MADLMNNGEQTFLDQNGRPLSGGLVAFFVPGTTVQADTFTDQTGTIKNANPVVLDQAGRATIWGEGSYRQVVSDQFGNVQWDRITTAGLSADAVLPGGLTVSEGLQVNGSLNVVGQAAFTSPIFANGGIQATNIHVTNFLVNDGTFQQNNQAFFAQTVTISGILTLQDSLSVRNDVHVGRDLFVVSVKSFPNSDSPVVFNNPIKLVDPGDTALVSAANNPAFSLGNTGTGNVYAMYNLGAAVAWAAADGNGRPTGVALMEITAAGDLTVHGGINTGTGGLTSDNGVIVTAGASSFAADIQPAADNTVNLGEVANGWKNVYAHNYVTLSTLTTSPVVASGTILGIVGSVAVKTLPHIGIAVEDIEAVLPGVVDETGKGINYNAVVGMLWQAIKELSAEFNAYKAAHP